MRRLIECHMLVFFGLLKLILLSVHPLADEQICACRIIPDGIRRSRIRTIGDLKAFPCRAENHIRCVYASVFLHRLPLLQNSPVFLRDPGSIGAVNIESPCAVNFQRISVAQDIMIDTKCF